MRLRFLHLCMLLLLTSSTTTKSSAQSPPTLLFQHLRTEDGLSSNNVWALAKDSRGYLWAGTESGLTRFDGMHCQSYTHQTGKSATLAGTNVHHILPAAEGNLWIGTQSGLSLYRRATNDFKSFYFKGMGAKGPQPQYVFPFFQDNTARLWLYLGARGIVATWNLLTGKVDSVTAKSSGYLFAAQLPNTELRYYTTRLEKGIVVTWLKGGKPIAFRTFFIGTPGAGPASFIDQVVTQSDTLLWLCADAGLVALNPISGNYKIFAAFEGRPVDANCMALFNTRFLLVGTAGEGLLLFDKVQGLFVKQYRHFSGDARSLAGNTIYRCLLDKEGNLFLSVADHGIDYTHVRQAVFSPALHGEEAAQSGISGNITALCPLPAGQLLCGTDEQGLLVYDVTGNARPQLLGTPGKIESLTPLPEGTILVHRTEGFSMYYPQTKRLQKLALQLPAGSIGKRLVQSFARLPGGKIIAATPEGLMEVQLQGNTLVFLPDKNVNKVVEWSNFQFVASLSDSLLLLQSYATNLYLLTNTGGRLSVKKEIARTPFRTMGMAVAGNTAYLATTTGLRRYLIADQQLEEAPEGITTACQGILKTDDHTLWISTTEGLYRYDIRSRHTTHFGSEDGLQEALFNPGALVQLPNGKGVAGGLGGLTIFDPNLPAPAQDAAPVALHQILVNDMPAGRGNPAVVDTLQLDYRHNSLSFSFNTIDFTAPGQNLISYQLTGYDNHALTALGGATVRYGQLPPGSYRFLVSASGGRQVIAIQIAPPWWQTGWARGLAILLIAGGIATVFWLRVRFVRRQARARLTLTIRSGEEERRRIARDLHDDFGARLATLKLYLLAAGKDPDLLKASAGLIDGAIVELRRILRNLSPRALEENGLQAAVADLAESINQTGVLHCELDMQAFPQRLAPRTEYALYRVVQELVGNTLKHAGATHLFLTFVVRGTTLVILYEDNGKGFEVPATSTGYGLQNIQTHVESTGGSLVLDTAPGRGLATTIEVPLNKSNLL